MNENDAPSAGRTSLLDGPLNHPQISQTSRKEKLSALLTQKLDPAGLKELGLGIKKELVERISVDEVWFESL